MKMSVSTRRSATRPRITRGSDRVRNRAECGCECRFGVGSVVEVFIDRAADDLRHGDALDGRDAIDSLPLFVGEVHLSAPR